eukprot:3174819-Pleurochrysis_carterae.AAC.1
MQTIEECWLHSNEGPSKEVHAGAWKAQIFDALLATIPKMMALLCVVKPFCELKEAQNCQ